MSMKVVSFLLLKILIFYFTSSPAGFSSLNIKTREDHRLPDRHFNFLYLSLIDMSTRINSQQLIGVDLSSFTLIADVSTRATMIIYLLYSWEIETAIYSKTIVFDVKRVLG